MDKMKILAVDDNIINLATIEQELKDKYEVITVNSGVRAIRYLNKEKPDLILLDVQMALMVVTITQFQPKNGTAQVELTIRAGTMQLPVDELFRRLARNPDVVEVHRGA